MNRPLRQGLPFGWMFGFMLTVAIIIGLIFRFVNTPIGIAFQRYVPKEKLGRVNAIINLLSQELIPFSTSLAGILVDNVPLSYFYLVVAHGMGFATLIAYQSKSLRLI